MDNLPHYIEVFIVYIILPAIVGLWTFFSGHFKKMNSRIEKLEEQMSTKLTEVEVRQILIDNLTPLKEGMVDLRDRLDKVIEILIRGQK